MNDDVTSDEPSASDPAAVDEIALERFEMQFRDRKHLSEMYACVLVKGVLPSGQRGYCYFGLFADSLVKFINQFEQGQPFNPKDIRGIVLARATGEPSPEIREFMRMKFSFAEDTTILEVSRNA